MTTPVPFSPFPSVTFTAVDRENFRKAYNTARSLRQDLFTFEGRQWDTGYAKYVLEYLGSFPDDKPHDVAAY